MRALTAVRTAPVRSAAVLATRLQSTGADDSGMTTAEYAVGTVAACGFGGVLYKVITNDAVLSALTSLIGRALTLGFGG